MRHDDAHLAGGQLERVQTPLRASNGTCVEVQIVTLSPDHWATMARGSIGTACEPSATKRLLTTMSASRHALLDVALDDRRVGGVVAVAHHAVGVAVGGPVGVHERRTGSERCLEVVDDRQLLVVDLDEVDGLLGDLRRERRDGGHDLALEAHVLLGEQVRSCTKSPYRTSGTSSCVATANTPGSASALDVSSRVMRPWVTPANLNFACSMPVRVRSAVYRPEPVTLSGPSARMKRLLATVANTASLES